MSEHRLHEILQSAYKNHSITETALLGVSDNVLRAMDMKKCALLVRFDLSAAFDTVDHSVRLSRLQTRLGITGTALSWFRSYLTNRKQSVVLQGASSSSQQTLEYLRALCWGLSFCVSTLYRWRHGIEFHLHADDSQLLVTFNPGSPQSALDAMDIGASLRSGSGWLRTSQ